MTSPLRAPEGDGRTPITRAIEERGRHVVPCPVDGFFGPGNKPIPMIGIRVNVKGEEDKAVVDAHRYAQELGKGTDAAKDDDLLREAKVVQALHWACREVDAEGKPTGFAAFPGPKWMRDNLTADELAALLNLYNDVRARRSPWPFAFEDEDVENVAMICAVGAETEIPTAFLARMEREVLAQYLIVVACKLRKARSELLAAQARLDEQAEPVTGEEPSP